MTEFAHHQTIHNLVREVRRLRRQLESQRGQIEDMENAAYWAEERATAARREANYQTEEARRAQDEASYREWQRQDALKDLERARQWGNDWDEQRALRKLKDYS